MTAIIVSESALVASALESSVRTHFGSIEKSSRVEAITTPITDIEVILLDWGNTAADVEALLSFAGKDGLLARITVVTREDTELQILVPLAGKVGAIMPHSSTADQIAAAARILRPELMMLPNGILPLLRACGTKAAGSSTSADYGLTEREKTVLELLAEGASNKTIARALDINDSTVRVHVRAVLHKLGVANRTQAALVVARGNIGP